MFQTYHNKFFKSSVPNASKLQGFVHYWRVHAIYLLIQHIDSHFPFYLEYGPFSHLQYKKFLQDHYNHDIQEFIHFIGEAKEFNTLFDAQIESPTTENPQPVSAWNSGPKRKRNWNQQSMHPDRLKLLTGTNLEPIQNPKVPVEPDTAPDTAPTTTPTPTPQPTMEVLNNSNFVSFNHAPYLLVEFSADNETTSIPALVDTGFTNSFITEDLMKHLGYPRIRDYHYETITIQTMTGQKEIPGYFANLSFAIDDQAYQHQFIVLPEFHHRVLLGYDFLLTNNISLEHAITKPAKETLQALPTTIDVAQSISTIDNPMQSNPYLERALRSYTTTPFELPPHRPDDYEFKFLKPLHTVPPGHIIHYSLTDKTFLQQEIDNLLEKQLIKKCAATNHYTTPFVAKGKKPRMVIDYWALNAVTEPLPPSVPTFRELSVNLSGTVLSALDLSSAYHHLRLKPTTASATTFRFNNQFYSWEVLPFGLTNAPEVFSRFLSKLLEPLHDFTRVYLDDILVFSKDAATHQDHLQQIFELLSAENLHLNLEKSKFFQNSIEWVGHLFVASNNGQIKLYTPLTLPSQPFKISLDQKRQKKFKCISAT
ncbi:hypothetical protein CANINC_000094 [Pichia inconspicua]|uniref:Reverse transcriptase domain-containing protein n=1 Tax=Pichia inconspicua TaxID=52247 RepID=A0A4T0X6X9_9ASCO|nr:hypothetical protein CANINC_000094 [[Candida] inconspicua]